MVSSVVSGCSAFTATEASANYQSHYSSLPDCTGFAAVTAVVRCGYLTVPENRDRPEEKTITVPVMIAPAHLKQASSDPLLHFAGGPGGDGFDTMDFFVDSGYSRDRDVIILGQRGTASANPSLTCPELAQAPDLATPYDSIESNTEIVDATRTCFDRFVAEGIDLGSFTTMESAADAEDLRLALGIDNWNILGLSYGTTLALSYLRDYPEHIRSVILDSTLPPQVPGLGVRWRSAAEGLASIFDACETSAECSGLYPDVRQTFTRLVTELENKPIVGIGKRDDTESGETPVTIDGGALFHWAVEQASASELPAKLVALEGGDPGSLFDEVASMRRTSERQAMGLHNSVVCSEWASQETSQEVSAQARSYFPELPSTVLSQTPDLVAMTSICQTWHVPAAPARQAEPARGDTPTLFLSGSFDTITAPSLTDIAAEPLSRVTRVTVPGAGHLAIGDPCARSVTLSFLHNPEAPNLSCVAQLEPPEFATH